MRTQKEWIVVGGGIGGAYMAHKLAEAGCKVTLIEGAAQLGGILAGPSWRGFELDNGCHLFDFAHSESERFFREVTRNDVCPVHVRYASIGDYGREDGIAVPDFSAAPEGFRSALLDSLDAAVSLGAAGGPQESCRSAVTARFGPVLAEALIAGIDKLCGGASDALAPEALDILSYAKRIRLDGDNIMAAWKAKGADYDDRLAIKARPTSEPRNYYPKNGGMRAFCVQLKDHLEAKGVRVLNNTRVTSIQEDRGRVTINNDADLMADKVYWSMPTASLTPVLGGGLPDVRSHFHPVRVDLLAFLVKAADIGEDTYIHDYRGENPVFRSSGAGLYAQQRDAQGRSFVIAEYYDSLTAPTWAESDVTPQAIFERLKEMGQVRENAHYDHYTQWSLPTGLVLPKKGWLEAIEPLQTRLDTATDWLVSNPIVPRGKRLIFDEAEELLATHL